jgi:AP-1 complex subunit beta-1
LCLLWICIWFGLIQFIRYASEVDVDFVRKSVKAIGQTAVKIEAAAERCVNVLLELIDTRVSYVVQEAVVVMKVRAKGIQPNEGVSSR